MIEFNSLKQLEESFPTEESCIEHFVAVRWPRGVGCPHCGSQSVYELKSVGHYKCAEKLCGKKFSWRYDTIFADSPLPLKTWFRGIFLMTSHKKGISSIQLGKDLGVTQKSAWHMLHRVREATMSEDFKRPLLTGTTQIDESLVGGKEHFKHANKKIPFSEGRGSIRSKTAIFAMLNSSGELRMQKLPAFRRADIEQIVKKNVRGGSRIHTDEATHYNWMRKYYTHSLVKHRMGQYVGEDGTTTNGVENAFSHFKRAITGVYHKASDEHIDRYLGMFSWRWTRRKMGEGERVNALLKSAKGHHLTYRKLTRKDKPE
jgi:transposase-like protein